jgi:glycosyltransferase involved in cell wall biosynthesis
LSSARPTSPRILGIAEGEPPTALSGIPHFLFSALSERYPVERLNYAPRGMRRLALAATAFRPSRQDWRSRFHTSALAHRVLSRTLTERLKEVDREFDITLQVLGWVDGQPRPYALYVDQTRLMAERGWPAWMPLGRRERSQILGREREMYERAFHLFTMGRDGLDSLVADYGVDPSRISVVGGGMSFENLPAPSELGPDPSILFVGKDFERKGGDCLVQAFKRVREELPEATLHIVGPTKRFDVPGIVTWGRMSSRERLAELYRGVRAFCLPSHYEPYGLVLIEAMAHGVPCIGAQVESIPDILGHGDAGILVPPGDSEQLADALLRLLTDDGLAGRLGAAGRRRVERELTWDHVAERMAPVIARAPGASG